MKDAENHNQEALDLIEECLKNGLKTLNLAGLEIGSLPSEIDSLASSLENIILGDNIHWENISLLKDTKKLFIFPTSFLKHTQNLYSSQKYNNLSNLEAALTNFHKHLLLGIKSDDLLLRLESRSSGLFSQEVMIQDNFFLFGSDTNSILTPLASTVDISPLNNLSSLEELCISGVKPILNLEPIRGLSLLRSLEINIPTSTTDLSPLSELQQLRSLKLSRCQSITDLRPIANLASIESLIISGCSKLADLSPIRNLHLLTELHMDGCSSLIDISPISNLDRLQSLSLCSSESLTDISALSNLTSIRTLNLYGSERLVDISPIALLTSLQSLQISGCGSIRDIGPLATLESLGHLNLSRCEEIKDLSPIVGLASLQSLNLSHSETLTDLSPIAGLKCLNSLDLGGCLVLEDLSPLAQLNSLESLNLSGCQALTKLPQLAGLTSLQSLYLSSCKSLNDITPIAGLNSLQSLRLNECSALSNLDPIAGITSLQHLDLRGGQNLTDLTSIANLTSLISLDIGGCQRLTDLTPLSSLTQLKNLNLSGCEFLTDISAIAGLTSLQNLNLQGCTSLSDISPIALLSCLDSVDLSGCPLLTDLTPVSGLKSLKLLSLGECQSISDISPIASLKNLNSLNLAHCESIVDINSLSNHPSLQSLSLSKCNSLRDISAVSSIASLRILLLSDCSHIYDLQPLSALKHLNYLLCHGTQVSLSSKLVKQLKGLTAGTLKIDTKFFPIEILSKHWYDNCYPRVSEYLDALHEGAHEEKRTKAFILGNGEVGKTQLRRNLEEKPFDPSVPTTHGVEIVEIFTPTSDLSIQLWDFGGQDIYHGTHSLFLKSTALFLVLWNPKSEEKGEFEQGGLTVRNERLPYWIEYVHTQSSRYAPIIVIQSQCENLADERDPPADLTSLQGRVLKLSFGAKSSHGSEILQLRLKDAVKELRKNEPYPVVPKSFTKLQDKLKQMQIQGEKRISIETFQEVCDWAGCGRYEKTALHFLHHSGAVFHDGQFIKDQVILDQNWALQPIYDVLHREKVLKHIRDHKEGRFTKSELAAFRWDECGYTVEEQSLFLNLMLTCGVCFKTREEPDKEPVYIAPELLPAKLMESIYLSRWPLEATSEGRLIFTFKFFHRALLNRLFASLREETSQEPLFWKTGCLFWHGDGGGQCKLELETGENGSGVLKLESLGNDPSKIQNAFKELVKIEANSIPYKVAESTRNTGSHPQLSSDLCDEITAGKFQGSIDGDSPNRKPDAYISYAWGDEKEEREEAMNRLDKKLQEKGFEVHIDRREIKVRNLISDYMDRLVQGDLVFLVISDHYLKSVACMSELYGIYQRSGLNKKTFLDKVIPIVLSDAKFSRLKDKISYADYWYNECQPVRELVIKRGGSPSVLGKAGGRTYMMMDEFADHVVDMLEHLGDLNIPRGLKAIEDGELDELIDNLKTEMNQG